MAYVSVSEMEMLGSVHEKSAFWESDFKYVIEIYRHK